MNNRFIRIISIILSSVLVGFSLNMFLLPHKILSAGFSGIAMIIGILTPLNTGLVLLILNIPVLIVGYIKLGKRFMVYTIISVLLTAVSMQYIPVKAITTDPILASIFGGVINGIGVGLIFRNWGSTGGLDVIGILLTRRRDFPLGELLFAMNAIIVLISGFIFDFTLALYTMLSIFTAGKVIDAIHTRHIKLTLMIITTQPKEMKETLMRNLIRGITIIDGEGAYTGEKRKILITVITRYDLSVIQPHIMDVDPNAFVNITETVKVLGMFRRE